MIDFVSIGEILIDCSPAVHVGQAGLYTMNPGGAPANIACVMAKLNHNSAFIGKVGQDVFGEKCRQALTECGVDTRYLLKCDLPTTLTIVGLTASGDRSFSFYRSGTADISLSIEDIDALQAENARIVHFGSVSLTEDPLRAATLYTVRRAKEQGSFISYDPNLRLPIWPQPSLARGQILEAMPLADIVKVSEEEAVFLWGEEDPWVSCRIIIEDYNAKVAIVTCGANGCYCMTKNDRIYAPAYKVSVVDTTGAGDSFLGGVLHCLLEGALKDFTRDALARAIQFGNAVGSLVTTKAGAIPAIPDMAEIEACIKTGISIKQ
jgi:fructokinase